MGRLALEQSRSIRICQFQPVLSLTTQELTINQPEPKGNKIYLNENNLDRAQASITYKSEIPQFILNKDVNSNMDNIHKPIGRHKSNTNKSIRVNKSSRET